MVIRKEKAVYHVMSRTALDRYPFGDVEEEQFVKIMKRFSLIYFAEVLGYCILGNHFHLLVRMHPGEKYSDEEIRMRFIDFHGDDQNFPAGRIDSLRQKWESLPEYIKDIRSLKKNFLKKRKQKNFK